MAKRIPIEKIAEMYEKKGCNITATCAALNIDRKTFYNKKNGSRTLQELLQAADESMLDFAESKLMEHINDGDITSLIFFLKCKGKKRGYVERVENEVSCNAFEALMKSLPDL